MIINKLCYATGLLIRMPYLLSDIHASDAKWLMNRRTMEQVRGLKDGDGRYLWQPSYVSNGRETLLGYPVYFSQYMPIVGSDVHAIVLGDFTRGAIIVDRWNMHIQADPYTRKPLISWFTTKRCGFGLPYPNAFVALKLSA